MWCAARAGKYGDTLGLSTSACTADCPGGYYCLEGSASNTSNACGGIRTYCPPGSSAPIVVSLGYYTVGGTPATRQGQQICPLGQYCPGDGLSYACPQGLYGSVLGLWNSSCTAACSAGYYCPAGSINATAMVCVTCVASFSCSC